MIPSARKTPRVRALGDLLAREEKAGTRRVIVQEENLIGTMDRFGRPGWFYDEAQAGLGKIRHLLRRYPTTVLFSTRDYAGFFASVYGTVIRQEGFRPFDRALKDTFLALDRGWAEVVDDIADTLPDRGALRLWAYEAFAELEPALLSEFVGSDAAALVAPLAKRSLPGPSARAIRRLGQLARSGEIPDAQRVRRAIRFAPKSPDTPAFDPWDTHERQVLSDLYTHALTEIAAHHAGAWLPPAD